MADDDTRYRIVQRRRTPAPEGASDGDEGGTRARRNTAPGLPAAIASGTAPPRERVSRPASAGGDSVESVVMMPRRFGGNDVVVEDHGDHIAIVLPGALRLVGTRDEAVALAAALLHTVERAPRR